jgi:hypothetical protein
MILWKTGGWTGQARPQAFPDLALMLHCDIGGKLPSAQQIHGGFAPDLKFMP